MRDIVGFDCLLGLRLMFASGLLMGRDEQD